MPTTQQNLRERADAAIAKAAGDRRQQILDQLTADAAGVLKRRTAARLPATDQDVYVAALAIVRHYESAFLADTPTTG